MDFYGRQAQARRSSRWLVAAFIIAVAIVVLVVNAIVLVVEIVWTVDGGLALLSPGDWVEQHPGLFWVTTVLVTTMIVGASLWKTAGLRAGGKVVARDLGAILVTGGTSDSLQRRLLNVVEEMAIASSVPVPAVYVLQSKAMNALAAGYSPSSASLIVTRGALLALDRDELQGVIGHEFSHILNGDMRLNTRLVGFLHGLFLVSELGRMLAPWPSDTDDPRLRGWTGVAGIAGMAGLALFAVGLVGLFTGRLLQAAVARQRERLADASAVQFTRESRGLRNALVKVGAHKVGSRLSHPGIDRVSHMLFASAGVLDFATHPPLAERIRALDPSFKTTEFGAMRHVLDAREARELAAQGMGLPTDSARFGDLPAPFALADPAAIAGLVGNPGHIHVQFAEGLRGAMPGALLRAAQDPQTARAMLLALALGSRDRDERLAFVRQQLGADVATRVEEFLPVAGALPVLQRLPAVLLLMGPLRQSSRAERQALIAILSGLVTRGGAPSIFDYALRKSAMTFLRDGLSVPAEGRTLPMRNARDDLRVMLSVVAANGENGDPETVRRAFDTGWKELHLPPAFPVETSTAWVAHLDRAIARVDRLASTDKERVVRALTATIAHDSRVNVAEAELLRLLCAHLHCPLPPLLADRG